MHIEDYQREAEVTAIYPKEVGLVYLALGLGNEAGEVQGKIKKHLRGDTDYDTLRDQLYGELGDVCWYLAQLCNELDMSLEFVMRENLTKLKSRQVRNVLKGNGDER